MICLIEEGGFSLQILVVAHLKTPCSFRYTRKTYTRIWKVETGQKLGNSRKRGRKREKRKEMEEADDFCKFGFFITSACPYFKEVS